MAAFAAATETTGDGMSLRPRSTWTTLLGTRPRDGGRPHERSDQGPRTRVTGTGVFGRQHQGCRLTGCSAHRTLFGAPAGLSPGRHADVALVEAAQKAQGSIGPAGRASGQPATDSDMEEGLEVDFRSQDSTPLRWRAGRRTEATTRGQRPGRLGDARSQQAPATAGRSRWKLRKLGGWWGDPADAGETQRTRETWTCGERRR
jgi:hypothetical protein